MVSKGLQLKPLITHRYKFIEAHTAFQTMLDGKDGQSRAPIKCGSYLVIAR